MNQSKVVLALRLMKMLQNNNTLTIDEIAAQLEVVPRTIYRYIDTFKESGFTVINITGNIYSVKSNFFFSTFKKFSFQLISAVCIQHKVGHFCYSL